MQLSLASMQTNKDSSVPSWYLMGASWNTLRMCAAATRQLCQLEHSPSEAKVVGLASLNCSVPWPQTLPLASASCPQNMCPWPQSRVGEKVQTNQFKSITTTRKTARGPCPTEYGCVASPSCMTYSNHALPGCEFSGSHFSTVCGQFIPYMHCIRFKSMLMSSSYNYIVNLTENTNLQEQKGDRHVTLPHLNLFPSPCCLAAEDEWF